MYFWVAQLAGQRYLVLVPITALSFSGGTRMSTIRFEVTGGPDKLDMFYPLGQNMELDSAKVYFTVQLPEGSPRCKMHCVITTLQRERSGRSFYVEGYVMSTNTSAYSTLRGHRFTGYYSYVAGRTGYLLVEQTRTEAPPKKGFCPTCKTVHPLEHNDEDGGYMLPDHKDPYGANCDGYGCVPLSIFDA